MADSRDQPELETLSYEPGKGPPTVMGFNSAVIKPETRVNKTGIAGQPLKERTTDCDCGICTPNIPEQPNKNLMMITEIEGLMSQVNEKLYKLPIHPHRIQALEDIDLFQRTTLFALRKALE